MQDLTTFLSGGPSASSGDGRSTFDPESKAPAHDGGSRPVDSETRRTEAAAELQPEPDLGEITSVLLLGSTTTDTPILNSFLATADELGQRHLCGVYGGIGPLMQALGWEDIQPWKHADELPKWKPGKAPLILVNPAPFVGKDCKSVSIVGGDLFDLLAQAREKFGWSDNECPRVQLLGTPMAGSHDDYDYSELRSRYPFILEPRLHESEWGLRTLFGTEEYNDAMTLYRDSFK